MNSKTPLKLALDIVMIVLFVILLDAFGTGLVFHEIAGLLIFVLFMIHIIFNWSWVKNVTKNLFNPGFKKKAKLMYILNAALLIGISAIIITGILISQVIFNFGANGNNHILVAVHKWVSYACAGLLAIHLAVHWRYILVSVRRTSAAFEGGKIRRTIETLGAAALLLVVLYSQIMPSSDEVAQNTVPPKGSSQDTITTRRIDSSKNSGVYDQDYTILQDTQAGTAVTVSLSDYLGNMFCTACDKHCPLLSLKCDRGNPQLQAAKIQYQKLYS
ncbi:hypothetical protein Psch_02584 [Pelotomaculum schinkii]|uniref:Flavinylation-associated cytochrome domain-containing protein n=2 Tax=Pelotomaculum TaxID=191373 RepID=A0A4Y7RA50_9FIRM|nr:DUF4405 domain-containing protein [Pelotomaculum schinkii]TEB05543.1 hypothetical protein Psch_02584 [Pelotomaculum schinkii]